MRWRAIMVAAVVLAGILVAGIERSLAQDSGILMPDESARRAKQLLEQAVDALGGTAYLHVHDVTCAGRLSQFGHSGELNGFEKFEDYAVPPDKDRTENLPQRNIIQVFNGDKGWTPDRGGVSEAAATDVAHFEEDAKKNIDTVLRHRIHEPGMIFRYGGPDIVDLQEADWVELVDGDNLSFRFPLAGVPTLSLHTSARPS